MKSENENQFHVDERGTDRRPHVPVSDWSVPTSAKAASGLLPFSRPSGSVRRFVDTCAFLGTDQDAPPPVPLTR